MVCITCGNEIPISQDITYLGLCDDCTVDSARNPFEKSAFPEKGAVDAWHILGPDWQERTTPPDQYPGEWEFGGARA